MFKELGAFIDEVGRTTSRMVKEMLSDEEDKDTMDGLTGCLIENPDTIRDMLDKYGTIERGVIVHVDDDVEKEEDIRIEL